MSLNGELKYVLVSSVFLPEQFLSLGQVHVPMKFAYIIRGT